MTDYIKREDAINFIANGVCTDTEADMKYTINKFNDEVPSADVIEVVRCKDCKYHVEFPSKCNKLHLTPMLPNDYCSYGEREEE